jgi:hypothetical protein
MRWILALVALLLASADELAAQGKGIRLWNLTTATIQVFSYRRPERTPGDRTRP